MLLIFLLLHKRRRIKQLLFVMAGTKLVFTQVSEVDEAISLQADLEVEGFV